MHVGRLKDAGKVDPSHISMLKMNNVGIALDIARKSRDVLGANGIVDDYCIMRHMNNLESVFTYEGTNDIHKLVIGEKITGIAALRLTTRERRSPDRPPCLCKAGFPKRPVSIFGTIDSCLSCSRNLGNTHFDKSQRRLKLRYRGVSWTVRSLVSRQRILECAVALLRDRGPAPELTVAAAKLPTCLSPLPSNSSK